MEKTFREKIALIVFALLVVVAGIVLISYFSTGRSWTIAATFVDDRVGEMDGYSVILFNGVLDPSVEDEDASGIDSRTDDAYDKTDAITRGFDGDVENSEVLPEMKDGLIQDDSVLYGSDADDGQGGGIQTSSGLLDPEHSIGLRILSMYPRALSGIYDGVFVSDVSDLYSRKGANVVSLNLTDLSHYENPIVFSNDSKKIGVFSAQKYKNGIEMSAIDRTMEEKGADVVACITPRLAFISDYDAVDIVILTTPIEEQSSLYRSRAEGKAFVVQSPEKGDVGLVILSSNDIPSSRVIEVL